MEKNHIKERELIEGFRTAALDFTNKSSLAYRIEFLSNDYNRGKKLLVSLEQELSACDEFIISVAFITKSGITPLLQTLKELEKKKIPGKILTTDYLCFSDPDALETISSLNNIVLKMYRTNGETGGYHTKGYVFKKEEVYRFIIGSSNLTLDAITRNREWNTKIVATENGEFTCQVMAEFNSLWNDPHAIPYSDVKESYEEEYRRKKIILAQQNEVLREQVISLERLNLKPNKMQVAFINSVLQLRKNHVEKAMLVSATGTGKTYASAFLLRELKTKRVLFVVHREQIAKQALSSYQKIFGNSVTYGLLSGNSKEYAADFLFSTMQMMAKDEIRANFRQDSFDIIILDECHRAGAESYQKIMGYFEPKFWLGMTASPDTNHYDIYSLFDHNIAYEIRLQQALEEDLLCPFHYFGITDLEIDGEVFDDETGLKNFSCLISNERVRYVLEKAEYFGYSGDVLRGLIFCSRKEEAKELSAKFNSVKRKDGSFYRTAVLTGEDSQSHRELIIDQLVSDNPIDHIDYIFTVDIFNEGVDIPEVNQVIMLRPTESPVVFIQQLGRGLRKYKDKEYVVILDFIGNYKNNFMIPIALSGDRSYNKDTMRHYVQEGARIIPGSSTIHFDEISRKRIYESIDTARTNDAKLIKESYQVLKYKLGRIPSILDFKEYGAIDISKIFEKYGSYYSFLKKYEPDYKVVLDEHQQIVIEFLSKKLVAYKRVHEIAALKYLVGNVHHALPHYDEYIAKEYHVNVNPLISESVYRNLTNQFPQERDQEKYAGCVLVERNRAGDLSAAEPFIRMLANREFKTMVDDLLVYGELKCKELYGQQYKDTNFQLYQKYNYEDVCRLLGWKKNLNAQNIGGYFYDKKTKTLPVFINYEKTDDAIAYEDRFVSESKLIALSKHPRCVDSADADHFYKRTAEDKDNRIFLFVRKNKDDREAKEFYFLGEIFAEGQPHAIKMEKTKDDAFEIEYHLDVPVRSDIYDYLVKG